MNNDKSQVVDLKQSVEKIDPLPSGTMSTWRKRVFNAVMDHVCNDHLGVDMRAAAVWDRLRGIPTPVREKSVVTAGGVLSFYINTPDGRISYSVWMFLGEVRISAIVPKSTISRGSGIYEAIQDSFDGKPCDSSSDLGDNVAFEWIFRDRWFANTVLMTESVTDDVKASMLADGIANILSRIFISIMNVVIERGGLVVTPENVLLSSKAPHVNQLVLEVGGECVPWDIRDALAHAGIHINAFWPDEGRRLFISLAITDAGIEVVERILNGLCPGRFNLSEIATHSY